MKSLMYSGDWYGIVFGARSEMRYLEPRECMRWQSLELRLLLVVARGSLVGMHCISQVHSCVKKGFKQLKRVSTEVLSHELHFFKKNYLSRSNTSWW